MTSCCPACGRAATHTSLAVETDRAYRVERCPARGLAFTVPRPTQDELNVLYGDQCFHRTDASSRLGYVDYEGESWAAGNADRTWDDLRLGA